MSRDASGSASASVASPSRTRAVAAARSASRRRCSASAACPRARSPRPDAMTAATRKTPRPTQSVDSAIAKRPVGGMWKKLNAAALADRREQAERPPVVDRHEQHRDEVERRRSRAPARSRAADRSAASSRRRRRSRPAPRSRASGAWRRAEANRMTRHAQIMDHRRGQHRGVSFRGTPGTLRTTHPAARISTRSSASTRRPASAGERSSVRDLVAARSRPRRPGRRRGTRG